MYQRTLCFIGLAAVAACSAMQSQESTDTSTPTVTKTPAARTPTSTNGSVLPYTVQRATLENGLKVLFVPMPSEGLVSYWSVVRTGSRDEVEPGVTGFAHFFEHMMFRGSEKFPARVYDEIVNAMGADANAFTTDDFTAYHLSFAKDDLAKVIEIEADRFQNLQYTEDQFKTEAGAVYGEYRKGRTNPFEVLFEAIQNTAFDKHTYKHTTIGFEADIQKMPEQYAYSKTFFDRFYRPENVVILVTGDFDPATTMSNIQQHYGGWKKGYVAPKVPVEPAQTKQRRIEVPFDGETLPLLTVNFKGEAFQPTDRSMVAATLVAELAFGETSALYKKLVLDEQRAEMLGAGFDYSRDPGLWSVYSRIKEPADVAAIEAEIWNTIDDIHEHPVTTARLDAVRSRMKYRFLSRLSTPSEVASSLARFIALTGDVTSIDTLHKTLDQITPQDVQNAARKFLTRERATVATLYTKGTQPTPAIREASATAKGKITQPPVLMPVAEDPNVAFRVWFQVGSQNDPAGKEGLATLTAALISDGGTKSLPYEKILEKLYPLAASYDASVDKEMTIVRGTVHRDNADAFATMMVDAIVNPGFRKADFDRIKSQMISGIENDLRFSSDEELGKAALYEQVFEGTRYAHIEEGTVASLNAITLDDVKEFHEKFFTRDNVVIGLGGAYSKTLPDSFASALGALPAGKPEALPAPTPAKIAGRHVRLIEKDVPTTAISFGYPIDVKRGTREFYALWIANSWLGEHRNSSSHLYQVIRETRGMNYGDYSYIEAYPNGGRRTMPPTGVGRRSQIFEVWIRPVAREQALFALRAALREVDKLATNGMTKEDFEATRGFLKKYVLHFAETTADRLGYAIDDRFYGVDGHLAKFRKMMDEITLEEVNAAVKKHLSAKNFEIAMVTKDATQLAEQIAADAPSPITYPAGIQKSDDILAEDKIIERFPLEIPAANIMIVPVETMFEGTTEKATG